MTSLLRRPALLIAVSLAMLGAAFAINATAVASTPTLVGLPNGNIEAGLAQPQDSASSDTLIAPPYVQVIFDNYQPAPVRFWCITSYAKWTNYLFVRHMTETDINLRCAAGFPVFVMAPECPPTPIGSPGVPFILIECGPRVFAMHEPPAPKNSKLKPHAQVVGVQR